ncbi:LOW QUALITY PROTEIN: hypothetical protein M8C21_026776, partial [Ambrosia artemisiifolia]
MDPFTIFTIIVSSLILYTCWTLITTKTANNLPPGPPKLPIIGNIHQLDKQRPHRKLTNLAQKYGPIMHLQLGQVSTVIISSPRLAQEILKIQDINFADRPSTTTSQIFFYEGSNIGWAPYGNYWRQLKKFATLELLSAKKVRSFFYIRENELTRVSRRLETFAKTPINFRELAREIVNNIVSRATLGDICKDRETLLDNIYFMLKTFNSFNMANYYPRLNVLNVISGKKAEWLRMHKEIDVILEKIIEEHKSRPRSNEDDHEDIVDILLRVKDTGVGFDEPLTNDRVKAIILEMLTAGTSSSSMTIEWAFCEMMKNQEIMRKAQSEVREVVKGNIVTEADILNLKYMKLVVKETMRLHCVPILLPRQNLKNCIVDGYDIPANTRILVNAWACATDPDTWKNPHDFIPERFENSSIGTDFEFLPFGSGRRMCPGMNFGLGTVEYVIATLLHRFNWKLPEGVTPDDLDMRELTAISTTANNLPPGPPKLPIIGNIHLLDKQRPPRKLTNLAQKYGPIMHLQLGQVSTVIISSPRLAQEILKIQDINFADRPSTTTSQIFFYEGSNIGWAPYGTYWRQLKKFATLELLSAKKVQSFFYIRENELTRVSRRLETFSKTPINFRELAREIVNNIVSRATLGDICKDRETLLDNIYFMLKTFNSFNMANYYPRLNYLNVISGKKAEWLRMHKEIDVIFEKIIEEHKSRPRSNQDDHEDIVDILLRVKDTGVGFDEPLTNDRVKAIILEMLTAGTSSSSMTIEWAFCEMMKNQEIMRKAQSEVRAVVQGNIVTEADILNLKYMKLVVKETMRLHCVPILLPRQNVKNCIVDGYDIPANTRILVNAWACATDPDMWKNPHAFIPERFENSSIGTDFEFLPFGSGRRMCPGMNFGLGTVEYVIATLLHRFNWKLPKGVTPDDLDMRELTAIS